MKAKLALFLFAAGIGCGSAFAAASSESIPDTCRSYCANVNGGSGSQGFRLCYAQCLAAGGVGY